MPIDPEELSRRLARADHARLALRRTTLEIWALGAQIRQEIARRHVERAESRLARLRRSD